MPSQTTEIEVGTDLDGLASGGLDDKPEPPTSDHSETGTEANHHATLGQGSTSSKTIPKCNSPETVTLRPGAPAKVASGLAVLSVRTAHEGSELYLTLGIASDRDTLAEAVLGAPARFHFKTSRGTYFVNVAEADLAVGSMTVQVGCEAE
jgi:hypothetical protein